VKARTSPVGSGLMPRRQIPVGGGQLRVSRVPAGGFPNPGTAIPGICSDDEDDDDDDFSQPGLPLSRSELGFLPEDLLKPAVQGSDDSSKQSEQTAATDSDWAGLQLDDHFLIPYHEIKLKDCLGTGAMGMVFRGFYQGREVAVKRLHSSGGMFDAHASKELLKEITQMSKLSHERLVTFVGACMEPPDVAVITEFMCGGNLHQLLQSNRQLTWPQRLVLCRDMAEGLEYLHCHKPVVVHRDIKPMNLILNANLRLKICDFGLSSTIDATHLTLTDHGGTPRYMAPESCEGTARITAKVDVWAMGCIIAEVFGGPAPYTDATTTQQIIAKMLRQIPPMDPSSLQVPSSLIDLLRHCIAFSGSARPTAATVHKHLQSLTNGSLS